MRLGPDVRARPLVDAGRPQGVVDKRQLSGYLQVAARQPTKFIESIGLRTAENVMT